MAAKLIALVVPLGLDTLAVAAALGAVGVSSALTMRITLLFTAFEAGSMPLIGLALGAPLGAAIGGAADYVAIGVLLAFGLYTLLASDQDEDKRLGQLTQAELELSGLLALASPRRAQRHERSSASWRFCEEFQLRDRAMRDDHRP